VREPLPAKRHPQPGADGFASLPVLLGLSAIAVSLAIATSSLDSQAHGIMALERLTLDRLVSDSAVRKQLAAIEDEHNSPEPGQRPAVVQVFGKSFLLTTEAEAGKLDLETVPPNVLAAYVQQNGGSASDAPLSPETLSIARLFPVVEGVLSFEDLRSDFTEFDTGGRVDPRYASLRVLRAIPEIGENALQVKARATDAGLSAVTAISPMLGAPQAPWTILVSPQERPGTVIARHIFEISSAGRVQVRDGMIYVSPEP
jgi:hypothetical protein